MFAVKPSKTDCKNELTTLLHYEQNEVIKVSISLRCQSVGLDELL